MCRHPMWYWGSQNTCIYICKYVLYIINAYTYIKRICFLQLCLSWRWPTNIYLLSFWSFLPLKRRSQNDCGLPKTCCRQKPVLATSGTLTPSRPSRWLQRPVKNMKYFHIQCTHWINTPQRQLHKPANQVVTQLMQKMARDTVAQASLLKGG